MTCSTRHRVARQDNCHKGRSSAIAALDDFLMELPLSTKRRSLEQSDRRTTLCIRNDLNPLPQRNLMQQSRHPFSDWNFFATGALPPQCNGLCDSH